MFFDAKFFTILAFIAINLLILFFVRTRTTTIISLIIAHLTTVVFFSLSISNYNSFKEIVLSLIIYSMVILFLISGNNPIHQTDDKGNKIKDSKPSLMVASCVSFIFLTIFLLIFLMVKNLPQVAEFVRDEKFSKQNEIMQNPIAEAFHSEHLTTENFYPDQKIAEKKDFKSEISDRKKARLKDKLSDNFLLKRSSDVILIIAAIIANLLLLSGKKMEDSV
jgi:hypothetical protein